MGKEKNISIPDDIDIRVKTEGEEKFTGLIDVPDPVISVYGCGMGNYSFAAAHAYGSELQCI